MDLDLDNLPSDVAVVLSDLGTAWNATGTHYFKITEAGNRVASLEHEGLPGEQYGIAWETIWRFRAAGLVDWRPVPDFQFGHGLIGTVVLTEQGIQAAKRAARKDKKIRFRYLDCVARLDLPSTDLGEDIIKRPVRSWNRSFARCKSRRTLTSCRTA